jgi:hypothetical protein
MGRPRIDVGFGFDARAEFLSRPEQPGEIDRAGNRERRLDRPLPLIPRDQQGGAFDPGALRFL